jgi:parvulin-like peptidyl-prolyl isomerase
MADTIVRGIEQNELIRLGADDLGITVTEDEAIQTLENAGLSVSEPRIDSARSQLLQEKLFDEYFQEEVPESQPQAHIRAMLLESEEQASEVRGRLLSSENFTALAGELSLDNYTKTNSGDVGWHPESIFPVLLGSSVPGNYAFGSEAGMLSQPRYDAEISKPVGFWLVKVLERDEEAETVQLQGLLLSSEPEALDLKARLETGEDLAALAEEFSQDGRTQQNGGEMGLAGKDELSPALAEYVFSQETEIEKWSQPVRDDTVSTTGAYWLVEVIDKDDDRQLSEEDRNYLLNEAFNYWLSLLWVDTNISIDDSGLTAEKKDWAIERALKGLR